ALGGAGVVYITRSSRGDGRMLEGQPLSYWVRCLESDDEQLRLKAIGLLPQFGAEAVPDVVDKLSSGEAQDRAVDVLAKIGAPTVRPLIEALEARSAQMRIGAIRALDQMGPALASPATTPVSKLLADDATGPLAAAF